MFAPLADLRDDDVWKILMQRKPPWGGSHRDLITLYRNAGGGECPLVLSKEDAPSCGTTSPRFGCWTCTVVQKDKSMRGLIDAGHEDEDKLEALAEFREWLIELREDNRNRLPVRRDGRSKLREDGTRVFGPFTLEIRKAILDRLKALEVQTGQALIVPAELDVIYDILASGPHTRGRPASSSGFCRYKVGERTRMSASRPPTIITSRATTFFRLFCTGQFTVPWHQRRYDWQPDHVDELLHDFADAIAADRQCYFLGTVILVESTSGRWRINDGQQRMVTLSLICACLLRVFVDHNDSHRAHMALRVLFDIDENSTDALDNMDRLTPRLSPPRDDKTRYNLMIRGRNIGANGKLTLAWRQVDTFVAGMGFEKSKQFFDFSCGELKSLA